MAELEERSRTSHEAAIEVHGGCLTIPRFFTLTLLYPNGTHPVVPASQVHGQTLKGSNRRLRQIRNKLGLSQSEFAENLSVSKNTVARWERGDLEPPKLAELAAEYLLLTLPKPKNDRR
jgi:DNA-binding XRE family transcriptional regulator